MSKYINCESISMIGKPPNALHPLVYVDRIQQKLSNLDISTIRFNGFVGGWLAQNTHCELECEYHGIWTCTIGNFLHQTKGCPKCLGCKKLTHDEIERNVLSIISDEKYIFHGINHFNGKDTSLQLECPEHGIWNTTTYNNFRKGYRCRKCGDRHLNMPIISENKLYFYILTSNDHFKYGISYNVERRMKEIIYSPKREYNLLSADCVGYTNKVELYIKNLGYHSFYNKEEYGDGYTETVDIVHLPTIQKILMEYIDET